MKVGIMAIFFAIFGTFSATSGRPQGTKNRSTTGFSAQLSDFPKSGEDGIRTHEVHSETPYLQGFALFVVIRVGIK